MVERYLDVEVEGFDRYGEPVNINATGWQARILQHECDHLDGTLYVDKMIPRTFRAPENSSKPLARGTIITDIKNPFRSSSCSSPPRRLRGLGDVAGEIDEKRGHGIGVERVRPEGLSTAVSWSVICCMLQVYALMIVDRQMVVNDLPVTLVSLLADQNWDVVAETVVSHLFSSTERIYNWATQIADGSYILGSQPSMKIDFIVGREIEVGGIYTGIVTNIKEHGAFVEFNGGHQGLLHISELSYEPVSRVSEVVSVGQKLSLMCIGQDVYGNIKLSLKATFPRPGILETNDVTEGSVTSAKETDGNASRVQEQQNSASELSLGDLESGEAKSPTSQVPVIVIRSAAECDEEEKSSKVPQVDNGVQLDRKSKSRPSQNAIHSAPKSKSHCKDKASVTAKDLEVGTIVTAKVYQIRAQGFVLDLGGGVRGVYRFEENNSRDFTIGDEMRVVCSGFSNKGIPVMDDDFGAAV
ncbi:Polyribonucleotide nucleotidyltransferase [Vigna angularis]|uniref:peptide deformylase n=1 Tax=Phaseolus angularis TaxID=3914 RepID=A0A8T0JVC0_PHAAN|nr:Polyribonucleotide nucleotidyltransferase [Vigna angularis]